MNSNTVRLGETLSVQSPEDIESFAHVLHAAHPDVDKLICKNGTKIVAADSGASINRQVYRQGTELGRDCAGMPKKDSFALSTSRTPGLNFAISGSGNGRWPQVSKSTYWSTDGGWGDWQNDWGRTDWERVKWFEKISRRRIGDFTNKLGGRYLSYLRQAKTAWLEQNPTWWEEKRREAEVDASSQVAGEMTDMNLDNRAIVAGHGYL